MLPGRVRDLSCAFDIPRRQEGHTYLYCVRLPLDPLALSPLCCGITGGRNCDHSCPVLSQSPMKSDQSDHLFSCSRTC